MTWIEFFAKLIESIAWPGVVLAFLIIFKDVIKDKFSQLEEGEIGAKGAKGRFTKKDIKNLEPKNVEADDGDYYEKVFSMLRRKINEVYISRFGEVGLDDDILKTVESLVVADVFKEEIYESVEGILAYKELVKNGEPLMRQKFMLRTVNLASQIESESVKENISSELSRLARNHKK